jgi:radical SAM protein with 4Fe4S-binding SPASM domain
MERGKNRDILFKRKQYRVPNVEEMESCQNCKYNKICGGGCFAENFEMTGSYDKIIMPCKQYENFALSESEGEIEL